MVLTNSPGMLQEIITFIMETQPELVWGKLSNLQLEKLQKFLNFSNKELESIKKLLYSKITKTNSPLLEGIKETDYFEEYVNFICMIADYITLKEAQEGIVRTRTIERFTVK